MALAVVCFAAAQWFGGSGFIASFVGGLLFGSLAKSHKHQLLLGAEGTGDTVALITWVAFGSAVVGQAAGSFSWEVVVYALHSLTVVRMLPVFLSLAGMNLGADEKPFMGWFGPRGLASIVFAVIVLNEHLPGGGTIATIRSPRAGSTRARMMSNGVGAGWEADPMREKKEHRDAVTSTPS